jgi:hypothetical protein
VIKVTTNLIIVYPGLGTDEKLKLTTKLDVEATVFSDLLKITLSKFLKTKQSEKIFQMTNYNLIIKRLL